ncbi:GNAT family N-acetyltransferase [Streptomyces sp. 796.1]|uniref:GNAT family N-acetyltransferase n=1 Tax=Streptomyces sp. 796.1 TaxID=3163029 RepID=UPI0039C9336A
MEFTTGGRLEVRISPVDVGKRVSVRRLNDPGGGPQKFTDTVGVLASWSGGVVRITRKNGEVVHIPEATLVAGKVIPPSPGARAGRPPVRRRIPATDVQELERVAARAWPPAERALLAPAGAVDTGPGCGVGWELRAAGGFTRRANSVLPLGDPGLPLDEALHRVRAWYAERGLPAYLQVSTGAPGAPRELSGELADRGWTREGSAHVWIAALAPLADREPWPDGGRPAGPAGGPRLRMELSRTVSDAWLSCYQRFGRPAPEVRAVLTGGPSVRFATVWAEPGGGAASGAGAGGQDGSGAAPGGATGTGTPTAAPGEPAAVAPGGAGAAPGGAGAAPGAEAVAIGRCVVDGRWAGFTAVEVAPAYRRLGLATAVMTALAQAALAEGASAAYLQVEAENPQAHALYTGLGFTPHHAYHHWRAPQDDSR